MTPAPVLLTRRTTLASALALILSACNTTAPVRLGAIGGGTRNPLDDTLEGDQLPPPDFRRSVVAYAGEEEPGTIVINTREKFLYLVEEGGQARRYGVGVGREGFGWKGDVTVGSKQEWPRWFPPKEMIARERAKGKTIPDMMEGGPGNPLGARAMYLYDGPKDTLFRIHGTIEPRTIGTNVSSGCIRMANADVMDLYDRVPVGTKVVVL